MDPHKVMQSPDFVMPVAKPNRNDSKYFFFEILVVQGCFPSVLCATRLTGLWLSAAFPGMPEHPGFLCEQANDV